MSEFPLLPMVFWLASEDVEVERLDLGRQIDSITLPSAWEVHFSGDVSKSDFRW